MTVGGDVVLGDPVLGLCTGGLFEADDVSGAFDASLRVAAALPDALSSMIASNSGYYPKVMVLAIHI